MRRESEELAARERALSAAQAEVEEPKKPAPAERASSPGSTRWRLQATSAEPAGNQR